MYRPCFIALPPAMRGKAVCANKAELVVSLSWRVAAAVAVIFACGQQVLQSKGWEKDMIIV